MPNGGFTHRFGALFTPSAGVRGYRSKDWTNTTYYVDVGISKGAAGVLALEGAAGESTPSKGVALLAAWVARWIGTV